MSITVVTLAFEQMGKGCKAALGWLRTLIWPAPPPPKRIAVVGLIVRPCIKPGFAEMVVRFDDHSHRVFELPPARVIGLTRDLAIIAAEGFVRK